MKSTIVTEITRKIADNSFAGYHEETVNVEFAVDGTIGGSFKGKWDTCALCSHTAPASEMGYINGVPYCYRYSCYQSKADQIAKEG